MTVLLTGLAQDPGLTSSNLLTNPSFEDHPRIFPRRPAWFDEIPGWQSDPGPFILHYFWPWMGLSVNL